MSLKIDVYTWHGSPNTLIPADIYGKGVGGAELSLMTWARVMAQRGHSVRIYNDPRIEGDHDGVMYLPRRAFRPQDDRDAWIVWRSPNQHMNSTKAAIKIHWSCDQQTAGDYARDIVPHVDKIVCISPRHLNYYSQRYQVQPPKIGYFDLGVLAEEYAGDVERVPDRFLFCSVPKRGLEIVHRIWPAIKAQRPEATLHITADYTLWGSPIAGDQEFRLNFVGAPGVKYLGNIPRERLVREQLAAEVHLYPCTYDELFCISAAECQVAGAWPITSEYGALATTNEFGTVYPGPVESPQWQAAYVGAVLSTMTEVGLAEREEMSRQARERFDWHAICERWEHLISTGEFEAAK